MQDQQEKDIVVLDTQLQLEDWGIAILFLLFVSAIIYSEYLLVMRQ